MNYGYVFESIEAAAPNSKVSAALNDDIEGAGLVSQTDHGVFVGSRLFNVASAAMVSLREEPSSPVIETPITIPEGEDWLSRFTLRLLNDSLRRSYFAKIPYRIESPAVEALDAGPHVEKEFVEAISTLYTDPDAGHAEEAASLLLIDRGGRPIAFKQHVGEPTTITFKPVQINAVRYPAGTLLNLKESEDMEVENLGDFDVARMDKDTIESAAALRFSAFAFRPDNRQRAVEPIADYEIPDDLLQVFTLNTLGELINSFPDQSRLAEVYADIRDSEESAAL
jgi:hypothetical protein